jgi:hypothetical protein
MISYQRLLCAAFENAVKKRVIPLYLTLYKEVNQCEIICHWYAFHDIELKNWKRDQKRLLVKNV